MTSEERFVPDSPVVEAYLKAAAADHQGHKALDLAVWYAIIQNYINRRHIQFLGQPFRVHFFLVAASRFGKSSSLDFGFTKFLVEYRKIMGQEDDAHFIDLSGQNTAAGLMDAFNDASDAYKYQILTAWIDETTYIFPKFMGRREQDIANLLGNVLFGRRDVRHVRERGSKKMDSVDRPVINACFPATPDQYVDLMKGTSSSDILKRFILLGPTKGDGRGATPLTRYSLNLEPAVEVFCQWQNVIDVNSGSPTCPKSVELTREAYQRASTLFDEHQKFCSSVVERDFFAMKQTSTLTVAALNAMSRARFDVSVEDVQLAWDLLQFSWDSVKHLDAQKPLEEALSPTQRQRRAVIERIIEVVQAKGKKGATRNEIRLLTWGLRYFSLEEADGIFAHIDKELSELFALNVDAEDASGRKYTKRVYFAKSVWTVKEACAELPITRPVWSSASQGFVDSLGNVHTELRDCVGYRFSWESAVSSPTARASGN